MLSTWWHPYRRNWSCPAVSSGSDGSSCAIREPTTDNCRKSGPNGLCPAEFLLRYRWGFEKNSKNKWSISNLLDNWAGSTSSIQVDYRSERRCCINHGLPVYLRKEELVGVLASLDTLTTKSSNLFTNFWRIFGLSDSYKQLPELCNLSVKFADHLDPE